MAYLLVSSTDHRLSHLSYTRLYSLDASLFWTAATSSSLHLLSDRIFPNSQKEDG